MSDPKPLKELLEEYEECLPHGLAGAACGIMASRLRALDERHQAVKFHDGSQHCFCGRDRLCPDRAILDGRS